MDNHCTPRSRLLVRFAACRRSLLRLTQAGWWEDHKLKIIGLLWLVALAAGLVGFYRLSIQYGQNRSWSDLVYQTLQLPFMQTDLWGKQINAWLNFARFFAPLMALVTGLQTVALLLGNSAQNLKLRYLYRGHVVICGLGRKGTVLAEQFRENGDRLVLIEGNGDNATARMFREDGTIVLTGDATELAVLRRAQVGRASRILCLCPDDETNAQICMQSWGLRDKKHREPIACVVQVSSPDLSDLLRMEMITKEASDSFRIEFFNIFRAGAWALLNKFPPFIEADTSGDKAPHVVIVGLGRFGSDVLVRIAREWNQLNSDSSNRLRITVVDSDAEHKTKALVLAYPKLQGICELVPWSGETQSTEFQEGRFLLNEYGVLDVSHIYICLSDQSTGVRAALTLRHALRGAKINVVVRMSDARGLSALLAKNKGYDSQFGSVHPFNLIENTCNIRLVHGVTIEVLAQAIHANYLRNELRLQGGESPDKPTLVPWDGLDEFYKESNRRQGEHIAAKLDAVGCSLAPLRDWDAELFRFTPEEVEELAKMEHGRWCDERVAEGWEVGPRDERRKRHPSMVPWGQLSKDDQDRDRDAILKLPEVLASIDLQIYRVAAASRDQFR